MSNATIRVFRGQRRILESDLPDQLLVGRCDESAGDPDPGLTRNDKLPKFVIAESTDVTVSRQQLKIESIDGQRYRITNPSRSVPLQSSSGAKLMHEESSEETIPFVISFGEKWAIRVEQVADDDELESFTLNMPTLAPGQMRDGGRSLVDVLNNSEDDLDATELMRCLLDTMPSFQNATTAGEFFQSAADALVDAVGLDYSAALTWDGQWHTVATCGSGTAAPSTRILNEVYAQRCSVRELPASLTASSLDDVKSLVAAPLLDMNGLIVGAVYGDRRYSTVSSTPLISELEAMFVELIASGAANGLARLKQQEVAARERSRFEDFFGPRLAKELEKDPELLEGRSSEVTVLFCDIRGFSATTDKLDVRTTLDWINDVLELLSNCVHDRGGVVVDYVGDEIMAMWGAPTPAEDHAERACDAAIAIQDRLSEIDEIWERVIGNKTEVSIGINSGEALVGNTGSRSKFKYGPLGTAVNKASRIQGTTKLTQCDIVISNETRKRISPDAPTRRLCQVQVINIPQPVELYELASSPPDDWPELVETYESALLAFENRDFPNTVEALGHLLVSHPNDGPTMVLLSRAVNAITNKPDASHPVWILDKK